MGRSAASSSKKNSSDDATTILLEGMDLARAVYNKDTLLLSRLIEQALPFSDATVENVHVSQSLGESFTGGRSTPVYHVTCDVCRNNNKKKQQRKHRSFVVKLILMPGNDNDKKILLKRESYAVERRFYDCAAPRLRQEGGFHIPKLIASDYDGSKPWPAICFLMNDIRYGGDELLFGHHPEFLSPTEAKRALRWIAQFHAFFWNDPKDIAWKRDLWTRGGFWTEKTTTSSATNNCGGKRTFRNIASQWAQTIRWMESKYPTEAQVVMNSKFSAKQFGSFLQAAAEPIATFLTRQSKTMIHGDYKAANLFLGSTTGSRCSSDNNQKDQDENDGDDESANHSVAVVDFQFSGGGIGPEDVAYLLFPDAHGHYFDCEDELLQVYHEELISQLMIQNKGGPSTMSFETLRGYYELSRLEFLAYLLEEKGWVGSTTGDLQLVGACGETMMKLLEGTQLSTLTTKAEDWTTRLSDFCGS